MEKRCSLCGKTVKELVEQEFGERVFAMNSINISIDEEFICPLCDGCKDFLMVIIPEILEKLGIVKFNEKKDKYELIH